MNTIQFFNLDDRNMQEYYYIQSELLELGLTKGQIKRYFPEPDLTSPNPHNKASSIKKFRADRVKAFLETDTYQEIIKNKRIRQEIAKKGFATKERNLLAKADKFPIIVPFIEDTSKLKSDAVWNHYGHRYKNLKHWQVDKYHNPSEDFSNSCAFNHILYDLSNYKGLLKKIKGKPGEEIANRKIEEKFLIEIKRNYPFLWDICEDRLDRLDSLNPFGNRDKTTRLLMELRECENLDTQIRAKRRTEQELIRKILSDGKPEYTCCICHNLYPIVLSKCGHLKKRAECNNEEKIDINNVMLFCPGCDALYENGFISVKEGKVVKLGSPTTDDLSKLILRITGNHCIGYKKEREKYFDWHISYHTNRNKL